MPVSCSTNSLIKGNHRPVSPLKFSYFFSLSTSYLYKERAINSMQRHLEDRLGLRTSAKKMVEVKLIGSKRSPFCTRIEWALKLKGVEYEYIEEDLMNKSELLLKSNPVHKKVPVLLHAGNAIAESLVILEYIDETWNHNPLLPTHPYDRAMARFWAKFSDEKGIYGVWGAACQEEGEEKKKAIEAVIESLKFLEKEIQGKKYFGGEEIGYVDLVVGWMCLWLNVLEQVGEMKLIEAERFPLLDEWTQNFEQIPLIKECLPPRDDLVNHFTASISYMRSIAAANKH